MGVLKTHTVALLFLLLAAPVHADEPARVTEVTDVVNVPEDATYVYVNESGQDLADILKALVDRAPGITKLELFHGANSRYELTGSPLKHLHKLESLEWFKFTGDPSLSETDFEHIGKLTKLKTLHLSLP